MFEMRNYVPQYYDDYERDSLRNPEQQDSTRLTLAQRHFVNAVVARGVLCLATSETSAGPDVAVFVPNESVLSVKTVRQIASTISNCNLSRGIVIHRVRPTSKAKEEVSASMELFLLRDLEVNVLDSMLTPQMELLDDLRAKAVIERYKRDCIPPISVADPLVRFCGWKSGDVVKTTYVGRGHEPSIKYLLVSDIH